MLPISLTVLCACLLSYKTAVMLEFVLTAVRTNSNTTAVLLSDIETFDFSSAGQFF